MSSQPPTNVPSSPPSVAVNPGLIRRRSFRWTFFILLWFFTAGLLGYVMTARFPKVVAEWKQPEDISYADHGPFVISVLDRSSWWDESKRYRYCTIGIVPSGSKNMAGAWTEYEFHNDKNDPEYIKQCKVVWMPAGIFITEPTGQQLFFPKKTFIE